MHVQPAKRGGGATSPARCEILRSGDGASLPDSRSEGGDSGDAYVDRLRNATGMRRSPRLRAAAEICQLAARLGTVNRRQVIYALSHEFGEMCLDRALQDLEAAGVLLVLDGQTCGWGGVVYALQQDAAHWHRRCGIRRAERSQRMRRGGLSKGVGLLRAS